jgi:hypothetical protein
MRQRISNAEVNPMYHHHLRDQDHHGGDVWTLHYIRFALVPLSTQLHFYIALI